jgi:putative nucleotidyltransferase with HDIG domain
MRTGAEALAYQVAATLRRAGYQAYLVGGCVRDLLLGTTPKDFDVSTDAPPERILELFPGSGQVGAHFGVVLVRDGGPEARVHVEVATFRSDHDYADGRRPSRVQFESDPRQDVLRRDFTINGLMMEPESGEVLDFVGGRADLDARVVRAIGDAEVRFREDHLRMLRAVRFAARLGFRIEAETMAAIRRNHAAIQKVSAERVRDELVRILTEGGARYGFELLNATDLLSDLLPEVASMKGVEQPPEFHPEGDVWVHTLLLLERLGRATPTLAWGALLHDVGKPATFSHHPPDRIRFNGHVEVGVKIAHEILRRLRFSNEECAQILSLVENHMRFGDVKKMKESTLKRFFRLPHFDQHLELHRIDCLSSHGDLRLWEFAKRRREELPEEAVRPPLLVTGRDLIDAGYAPGPRFKEMLAAAEDAQLEGRIGTREEGLELIRRAFA